MILRSINVDVPYFMNGAHSLQRGARLDKYTSCLPRIYYISRNVELKKKAKRKDESKKKKERKKCNNNEGANKR